MTIPASEALPGTIYRRTREVGTYYYRIVDEPSKRRLEKRIRAQGPKYLKAADRFVLQALALCETEGHVLAMRILRYRDATGAGRETKAYVAFPPDYPLREVATPPGYGPRKAGQKVDESEVRDV